MKTLARANDAREIRGRLEALGEGDGGLWGVMQVGRMVCHLADSYEVGLGERTVSAVRFPVPRGMLKWLALSVPLRWAKGIKTAPELEVGKGASEPGAFAADKARMLALHDRFVASPKHLGWHPFFGDMTTADWMRWGYLHSDHHLRQFGR